MLYWFSELKYILIKGTAIEILKTFTGKEISEFSDFLDSPFHNTNRSVVKLFELLKKHHPHFDNKKITKEEIFGKIYPGKAYNEQTMKSVLFNLAHLAERYLLYISFDNYDFEKSTVLLREFAKRKVEKLYFKKLEEAEKILGEYSAFEVDFFENKRILETIKADYLIDRKDMYSFEGELSKRNDYVVLAFLRKLFLCMQDIQIQNYEVNLNLKDSLAEEAFRNISIEKILAKIRDSENPWLFVIELKYNELLAMMNLDIESYIRYKNVVMHNINMFSWAEKHLVLGVMSSICIMGLNKGVNEFSAELLDVCKKRLDENCYAFSPEEYTNIQGFFNLLTEFIENNEHEYFGRLMKEFGKRLNPEYKESVINFAYMKKKFQEKKFEEALAYNSKIDYNHSLLKFSARILLLKVYFELGFTEELLGLLDSSQKFFSGVIHYSEKNLARYLNLISYLKKLALHKEAGDIEKIETLKKQILQQDNINAKDWLLEKIDEVLAG